MRVKVSQTITLGVKRRRKVKTHLDDSGSSSFGGRDAARDQRRVLEKG